MTDITKAEKDILCHALGINGENSEPGYRNHYCGDQENPVIVALVAKGLIRAENRTNNHVMYSVTTAGKQAVRREWLEQENRWLKRRVADLKKYVKELEG